MYYLINKMEKELQIIVSKIKYENFIFNYHTPYGNLIIKYEKNKLHLVNFIENPIWKNEGCKESLQNKLKKISQNLKKSKL